MNTNQEKENLEKEHALLAELVEQLQEVTATLLKLRKPSTAYEINKSIDNVRQVYHWIADGYNLISFANKK